MNTQAAYEMWRRRFRNMGLPNVPCVVARGSRRGLRDHVADLASGFTCSLDFAVAAVDEFRPFPRSAKRDPNGNEDALALRGDWIAVGHDIQTALDKFERELIRESHARE